MRKTKQSRRLHRKIRIRKKISGTMERPRLVVFKSNRFIYAQLIDDEAGKTLASTSSQTLAKDGEALKMNKDTATQVGKEIARIAQDQKIEQVVFDRNGYLFHGRIKALADGAREGGLKF